MVGWNFARGLAWLALSSVVFSGYSRNLAAQDAATCKGPAELEQTIKVHPSAGAYDALGAYFGQRQKISCAISAFESAVHLDPNSWEAHFNLSLALLQSNQPARAARELRIATRLQPDNPLGHTALGVALSQLNQDDAAIDEFKLALNAIPNRFRRWTGWRNHSSRKRDTRRPSPISRTRLPSRCCRTILRSPTRKTEM